VQVGKSHKINKRAGWNKAVQVGIFHFLLMKNKVLAKNYPELINMQDGIRACRLEFCKKLIRFAARLFDSLKYHSSFSHLYQKKQIHDSRLLDHKMFPK